MIRRLICHFRGHQWDVTKRAFVPSERDWLWVTEAVCRRCGEKWERTEYDVEKVLAR